jgi:2-oxoglutarate ferredoxin oxidoreductase subunit delta
MKHPDECIGCANCGYVCPDGCLTIYRKKVEETVTPLVNL